MRVSNGLAPDQARYSVGPDLGPNCLRMLRQTTQVGKELKFNVCAVPQLRLLPNVNFQGLLSPQKLDISRQMRSGSALIFDV